MKFKLINVIVIDYNKINRRYINEIGVCYKNVNVQEIQLTKYIISLKSVYANVYYIHFRIIICAQCVDNTKFYHFM